MNKILKLYEKLHEHFGPQDWWPAETALEMMVGAVLTQNTSWKNVEKAIDNLRSAGALNFLSLSAMSLDEIAQLIRPSGYYNLKAKRLKNLLTMISIEYAGDIELLRKDGFDSTRTKLLEVKGVGPETADSILLYACNHPVFVVDAYTYRILNRHNLVEEEVDYETIQALLTDNLPPTVELFNEFHALFVKTASKYCKKSNPLCDQCPLNGFNL